ncbi:MAG: glycosyltransferase family 4 protein [Oscillospiraceae bacterium]|nr:glycosyltransferase family 4 protein [Oscillospiraceae bacterium]
MKVLFVNVGPIQDRRTWSGTPYSLYQELCKYYEIEELVFEETFSDKLYTEARRCILKENGLYFLSRMFAKRTSKELSDKLNTNTYDAAFVIGCACLAYVRTDVPIVYFTDTVFSAMVNYYWYNMSEREIREYNETQKLALQNADITIVTSKWAKDAAVYDYHIEESKIKVHHFGSNIEVTNVRHLPHDDFNILFVGADLKRKGIDLALECVHILNQKDSSCHYVLHVVGGTPEQEVDNNEVKVYGFINRNMDAERQKLDYLRETSDLFLLPTRAECAGIVFCEAAAYGLPSISFDTGGVSDYILDGETGFLMKTDATANDFADKVLEIAHNKKLLESMKKNARELYKKDLNWTQLGLSIKSEIEVITAV